MRIGLQTIAWGTGFPDLDVIAAGAKQLGYEGLEFGQSPEVLWQGARLGALLNQYDLYFIGLTGGSLESQLQYVDQLEPRYLCIDTWDEGSVVSAVDKGLRVGIHPHLYKNIETVRDADPYLQRFPTLGLVLDTGHQYLADDNILDAIENYRDRILAIHLKDWNSRYGRSPFRYARGFAHWVQAICKTC